MDDATVRISMGLRLGLPLCRSPTCQHCGAEVSQFATHDLKAAERVQDGTTAIQLSMTSYTELWLWHMYHHVWNLRVCITQMGSDLMVSQVSLENVANF